MAKLFFSYSHKDEALRDELQVHLTMLKRNGLIEPWHDRRIKVGDELDGAIDQAMTEADVILLLVSPDFLASNYCYDVEVKRAMERHKNGTARVIAVILRPCEWEETPFSKLLLAPTDGKAVTMWPNRDAAFKDVTRMIREALPKVSEEIGDPLSTVPQVPLEDFSVSSSPPESYEHVFTPRSSNLAVRKIFTDADKDRFLDQAFDYMARFFEGSLAELEDRHPEIEAAFKRVDAHGFTAVIYREGKAISRCAIQMGPALGSENSITYGQSLTQGSSRSFNEYLQVETGQQSLSLKPGGISMMMNPEVRDSLLTFQGASEFYWSKLIEPLQR